MKFIVSSGKLLKEIQILIGIINTNNSIPILDNFLLSFNKKQLTISSSDLETNIFSTIPIDSENSIDIAIPARTFLDILKILPEQPLTFTIKDEEVEISTNKGKYNLKYFDGEDFPVMQDIEDAKEVKLSSQNLADIINVSLFAVGNDDLRPVMNGIFFEFSNEKLTFVTTDAQKLVKFSFPKISFKGTDFIMPKKPLHFCRI